MLLGVVSESENNKTRQRYAQEGRRCHPVIELDVKFFFDNFSKRIDNRSINISTRFSLNDGVNNLFAEVELGASSAI